MAKKVKVAAFMPPEPSPQDELDWHMSRAVEKAVLAHPQTQKLRTKLEKQMRAAAKTPADNLDKPKKKKTSTKKPW